MLWFNFILGLIFISLCFKLVTIHYYTPKQRDRKFKPSIKLNPNIYIWGSRKCRINNFLSATILYICNKATSKYHLYLTKTADLVMVKIIYLQSLQRIRREKYTLKMLKIKYEIFRHASYVTDRSFQEMRELFKKNTTLL